MSPDSYLWGKKFRYEWQLRLQMIRLSIDWVVTVYIIIPALIISSVFYVGWLQELPAWFRPELLLIVLSLLTIRGVLVQVDLYLTSADLPTCLGTPFASRRFIFRSIVWTYLKESIIWLVLFGLLFPFFRPLLSADSQIWVWWAVCVMLQGMVVNVNWLLFHFPRPVRLILGGLFKIVVIGGVFLVGLFYFGGAGFPFVASSVWFLWVSAALFALSLLAVVQQRHWDWDRLVTLSEKRRSQALVVLGEEQPVVIGKWLRKPMPWMKGSFRTSFTPEGAIKEWRFKQFVRTYGSWSYYMRVLALGAAGLWWMPTVGKVFGFCLIAWIMSETLVQIRLGEKPARQQMLPVTDWQMRQGIVKAYQWIFTVGLTILLIPAGFGWIPWYGWVVYPFIGYSIATGILLLRF